MRHIPIPPKNSEKNNGSELGAYSAGKAHKIRQTELKCMRDDLASVQSLGYLKFLRGGRMTKWKGLAASVAPVAGSVILSSFAAEQASAANECGAPTGPNATITCDSGTHTVSPATSIV